MKNPLALSTPFARLAGIAALSAGLLGGCGGSDGGSGFSLAAASGATGMTAKADPAAEADVPPAIGFHPHSLMVKEGEPAMFGVIGVMGGAPARLRYQWRRDGVDIPGADKDHLILGATSLGDDGAQYSVVITNAAGQAVSKPGVLAVVSAATELPWR